MYGRSFAAVRILPTSAGTTALIGDPGPTYTHSVDLTAFAEAPETIAWPFPETSRAQMRRAGLAMQVIATAVVAGYQQLGEAAAKAARAFEALERT